MSVYLHLHDVKLYVQNFNNDFLLLKGEPSPKIAQIGTAIFQHKFDFIAEVIVTEVEICLKLNEKFQPAKIALLTKIQLTDTQQSKLITLPVCFSTHEDWQQVIGFTGFTRQSIIRQLLQTTFDVAMFGFLPGFTYFSGLDPSLHLPRKSIPAKQVAANSLAIGGKYLGLYSISSPGGWYVIGRIPIPILQIPQIPPVQLQLGDHIRLKAIDTTEFERLSQQEISDKYA